MNLIHKMTKFILIAGTLSFSLMSQAKDLKCSSVGKMLPQNRITFNLNVKTSFWGGSLKSGSYAYIDPQNGQTIENKFTCGDSDDYGQQKCVTTTPDANIISLGTAPVIGIYMQITGQQHVVLFNCGKI